MSARYLRRSIESLVERLLGELPALLIVGPRASGKTTTAIRHARTVVRLDRPAEAQAFRADPDAALRGLEEPILLDEWQEVPDVLGAVKRSIDQDTRPGRYLLTGSVRAELEAEGWPGTGRLVRIPLYGLTVNELGGHPDSTGLIDRLARGEGLEVPHSPPDLAGYIALALSSGFPEAALAASVDTRNRWLESYVDQIVGRDALHVEPRRDPARLRRFVEAYALASAGVPDDKTLFEAAGINRKTGLGYERLLTNLMLVESLPAWTSNRLKRLVRPPKRYLVDAGLLSGALRVDERSVMRDGDLLGRVLDTFVTSQVRAELAVAASRPRLFHLRTQQGRHEVDLVGEIAGSKVMAIEIKATASPRSDDARHIVWLRDQLGERFVGGVVLHTGPRTFPLAERITAAPIATLWA